MQIQKEIVKRNDSNDLITAIIVIEALIMVD